MTFPPLLCLDEKRIEIDFNALGYAQVHRNSEMISLLKERGATSEPKEAITLVQDICIAEGKINFNPYYLHL